MEVVTSNCYPGLLQVEEVVVVAKLLTATEVEGAFKDVFSILQMTSGEQARTQLFTRLGSNKITNSQGEKMVSRVRPLTPNLRAFRYPLVAGYQLFNTGDDYSEATQYAITDFAAPCIRYSPNGIPVPFTFDQVVKQSVIDLTEPKVTGFRELNQLLNVGFTTGSAALAKNIAMGLYAQISAKEVVPPLLPVRKLLARNAYFSLIGPLGLYGSETKRWENGRDFASHEATRAYYYSCDYAFWRLYAPGSTAPPTPVDATVYRPNLGAMPWEASLEWGASLYFNAAWITIGNYLPLVTTGKLPVNWEDVSELPALANDANTIICPIMTKLLKIDDWLPLALSAFSGWNYLPIPRLSGMDDKDARVFDSWLMPHETYTCYDLPGAPQTIVGGRQVNILFVIMDEWQGEVTFEYGGVDTTLKEGQQAQIQNFTLTTSMAHEATPAFCTKMLQYAKWIAGPLEPLCHIHAASNFRRCDNYLLKGTNCTIGPDVCPVRYVAANDPPKYEGVVFAPPTANVLRSSRFPATKNVVSKAEQPANVERKQAARQPAQKSKSKTPAPQPKAVNVYRPPKDKLKLPKEEYTAVIAKIKTHIDEILRKALDDMVSMLAEAIPGEVAKLVLLEEMLPDNVRPQYRKLVASVSEQGYYIMSCKLLESRCKARFPTIVNPSEITALGTHSMSLIPQEVQDAVKVSDAILRDLIKPKIAEVEKNVKVLEDGIAAMKKCKYNADVKVIHRSLFEKVPDQQPQQAPKQAAPAPAPKKDAAPQEPPKPRTPIKCQDPTDNGFTFDVDLVNNGFERYLFGTASKPNVRVDNESGFTGMATTHSLPYRKFDSIVWLLNSKALTSNANMPIENLMLYHEMIAEALWARRQNADMKSGHSHIWESSLNERDSAMYFGVNAKLMPVMDFMCELFDIPLSRRYQNLTYNQALYARAATANTSRYLMPSIGDPFIIYPKDFAEWYTAGLQMEPTIIRYGFAPITVPKHNPARLPIRFLMDSNPTGDTPAKVAFDRLQLNNAAYGITPNSEFNWPDNMEYQPQPEIWAPKYVTSGANLEPVVTTQYKAIADIPAADQISIKLDGVEYKQQASVVDTIVGNFLV